MRKPGIPSVPKHNESRARFDQTIKESLEVIMGRRGDVIKPLNPATVTAADCARTINEILARLQ